MPENTEAERLRAVREAYELEMHRLRMYLQESTERIDHLRLDREHIRQEKVIKESLDAEINQLKLTHAREIEELKTALAGATHDRAYAFSESRKAREELDDLRRRLEGNDVEQKNLRNVLQREGESLKGVMEENRLLKEKIAELKKSHLRAIDKSATVSQSLRREQETTAATQQSLRRERDEKSRVVSQNQRLAKELDNLKRQLESNETELRGLRKGAAVEEIQKLKGEIVQLRDSHRRAIDESAALSRSLKQEQAVAQQSLRREKDEKSRVVSQNQRLTGELDGLGRQLESKDVDLKNLRNALQQGKESLKGTVEENWMLKEEVGKLKVSHQRAVDESTALSQSFKQEREGKDAEVNNLQNALQQLQIKRDELVALLDTRSRELKGAQVSLTHTDTLSDAEVIALVDALNVEILQTSTFVSDSFDYAPEPAYADGTKAASVGISEFIGSTLASLVTTASHSENDFLVQIALQSAAVELSRQIILTWDLGYPQTKQPLAKLYSDIRETGQVQPLNRVAHTDDLTETQAVGGRWRALTRAHAQKVALWEGNPHATMVARISDTLVAILVAARCTKSYEETRRTFADKFGEHISGIVKMALRLNKVMGEEVTSADLRPINVASGEKFDAATMVNFESHEEDLKGQAVLCTTALGVQRSERVARGDVVEFETTILVKPKVAVESVVDVVDGVTR